jgi:hypothetical protein
MRYLLLISLLFIGCSVETDTQYMHRVVMYEKFYFTAQKDFLCKHTEYCERAYRKGMEHATAGAIVVKKSNDKYVWTGSPWKHNDVPMYQE